MERRRPRRSRAKKRRRSVREAAIIPTLHRKASGIETYEAINMIRKGQVRWVTGDDLLRQIQFVDSLFSLAGLRTHDRRSATNLSAFALETCNTTLSTALLGIGAALLGHAMGQLGAPVLYVIAFIPMATAWVTGRARAASVERETRPSIYLSSERDCSGSPDLAQSSFRRDRGSFCKADNLEELRVVS